MKCIIPAAFAALVFAATAASEPVSSMGSDPTGALNELLPRPKEILSPSGALPSCEGMPSGGYAIAIRKGNVDVVSVDAAGRRNAEATLAQLRLLSGGALPDCSIRDWPTFPWRGFMHDCGRNFLDVQTVKSLIDLMAQYKLNLFHWHITDYYGWRLESKKYPMLQAHWAFGRQHGKYYTQKEFREVIDYAKERGVTIMPELDVPGHSLALRRGLNFTYMSEAKVKKIVTDLIDELCSLASAEEMPFVHLGTDEARTPYEMVPDSYCPAWAEAVWRNGRMPVGWCPGKPMATADGRKAVKMVWHEEEAVASDEKAFDTAYWYFGRYAPFSFTLNALFAKPCRWDIPDANKLGVVIASWHDDRAADDNGRDVIWNNNFAAATVMFSDVQWNGRKEDRPDLHFRMPRPGTDDFAKAVAFEAAVAAQRDKVLAGSPWPFSWVRQTDMRWRVTDGKTGALLGDDVAQGCVVLRAFARNEAANANAFMPVMTGVAVLETWIKSPVDQTVGAWVDFECYARSGGRNRGTPEKGEWSIAKGAKLEVNGVAVPPPEWKNPGLKYIAVHPDEPTSNNVAETPFTDECCWIRPPTQITLKAGWNHVKLTVPKEVKRWGYGWQALFMPILGTSDHPREVPGLAYRSSPPQD